MPDIKEIIQGSGSPEGVVQALPGQRYYDYTNKNLWVKEENDGITGWVPTGRSTKGAAALIADGGTITHGLGTTPISARATSSVAGEMVSITAISSTLLTVAIKKHDGTAGTTQTVYWQADV